MDREEITHQLGTSTTRRTVVKTGAKIAYAAPIVAASFKVSAIGAGAVSGPTDNCPVITLATPDCFWLSNITNCWVVAGGPDGGFDADSQAACQANDTCAPGGGGVSGGGCYKWAVSSHGAVIAPPW